MLDWVLTVTLAAGVPDAGSGLVVVPEAAVAGVPKPVVAALRAGVDDVERFFGGPFTHPVTVRMHKHRADLDKVWAEEWKAPDFKSECWMVASGVAETLDLLDPAVWGAEACEHDAKNQKELRRLLTHELVHVFHAQHNSSGDFTGVDGLDWFVEGLGVLASGQLDDARLVAVRALVKAGKAPASVDDFWKGKHKYGLAGSLVATLDRLGGREKLVEALAAQSKKELLASYRLSEAELLKEWKKDLTPAPPPPPDAGED